MNHKDVKELSLPRVEGIRSLHLHKYVGSYFDESHSHVYGIHWMITFPYQSSSC